MHLAATLDASVDGAVEFEFEVTNTSEEPVDLTFSSGKTADVTVSADDSEVWRWSEGQLFIAGTARKPTPSRGGRKRVRSVKQTHRLQPGRLPNVFELLSLHMMYGEAAHCSRATYREQ